MSYGQGHSQQGEEVLGSIAHYLPFGDWRVEPAHDTSAGSAQALTDQAFTGQKHNMDPSANSGQALGLYYYNARFYLPGIGRFASADTLVPDPMNPQQFNRYTYTLNNPLRFTDSTGHCAEIGDEACWSFAENLCSLYCDYYKNNKGFGWWDLEYLGKMEYSELVALERRINPENWVRLSSGRRIWVGEGTNPSGPFFESCQINCPGPEVEMIGGDNSWTWELGFLMYRLVLDDKVHFSKKTESSYCVIMCWPDKLETTILYTESGTVQTVKDATPIGVGVGFNAGDVGLKVSLVHQKFDALVTSPTGVSSHTQGREWVFQVVGGPFSFTNSKRIE